MAIAGPEGGEEREGGREGGREGLATIRYVSCIVNINCGLLRLKCSHYLVYASIVFPWGEGEREWGHLFKYVHA